MQISYTIIGTDGQQYGPVTVEQLKAWVGERRILPETKVMRSDGQSWLEAWQYVELGIPQPAAPASAQVAVQPSAPGLIQPRPTAATSSPPPGSVNVDPALVRRVHISARWFYWIAGLSLVNAFIAFSNANTSFIVGLGITQLISGFAIGLKAPAIGLALDIAVSGICALFGFLASKGKGWAFLVGMVLYALDGLIYLYFQDWLPFGFHVLVLYWIFLGWRANQQLQASLPAR